VVAVFRVSCLLVRGLHRFGLGYYAVHATNLRIGRESSKE